MAAEAEVLDELRRLRARLPQLTGALAASADGLVLARDTPGVEPEGVAALTAAALGVALRMADATDRGDFRELLVRGERGYVATYAAGPSAVLTLLAEDRVNVGRLHLEGRRSGSRIAEAVAAVAAQAAASGDRKAAPRAGDAASTGKAETPGRASKGPGHVRKAAEPGRPADAGGPGDDGAAGTAADTVPAEGPDDRADTPDAPGPVAPAGPADPPGTATALPVRTTGTTGTRTTAPRMRTTTRAARTTESSGKGC